MKTLRALALGTVPVVGLCFCLLLCQVSGELKRGSDDEHELVTAATVTLANAGATVQDVGAAAKATIGKAATTLDGATAVLRTVNRPCIPAPCGTLADVAETLHTVRGTFGQLEVAARHEDRNLGTLDAQELQLFTDTHTMLGGANALLSSPEIQASLKNLDTSTTAIADSTRQADAILVDARIEADKLTHPPKKKLGFWGATMAAGDWLRHFMPPLF